MKSLHDVIAAWRKAQSGGITEKLEVVTDFREYIKDAPTGDCYELLKAISARGHVS